jgi:hypothetical protein
MEISMPERLTLEDFDQETQVKFQAMAHLAEETAYLIMDNTKGLQHALLTLCIAIHMVNKVIGKDNAYDHDALARKIAGILRGTRAEPHAVN